MKDFYIREVCKCGSSIEVSGTKEFCKDTHDVFKEEHAGHKGSE